MFDVTDLQRFGMKESYALSMSLIFKIMEVGAVWSGVKEMDIYTVSWDR